MASVLILAKDPKRFRLVLKQVSSMGHGVASLSNLKRTLDFLMNKRPDLVFLSINYDQSNPLKFANIIQNTFHIPVYIFPEEFDFKTTRAMRTIKWDNIISSNLSGQKIANCLKAFESSGIHDDELFLKEAIQAKKRNPNKLQVEEPELDQETESDNSLKYNEEKNNIKSKKEKNTKKYFNEDEEPTLADLFEQNLDVIEEEKHKQLSKLNIDDSELKSHRSRSIDEGETVEEYDNFESTNTRTKKSSLEGFESVEELKAKPRKRRRVDEDEEYENETVIRRSKKSKLYDNRTSNQAKNESQNEDFKNGEFVNVKSDKSNSLLNENSESVEVRSKDYELEKDKSSDVKGSFTQNSKEFDNHLELEQNEHKNLQSESDIDEDSEVNKLAPEIKVELVNSKTEYSLLDSDAYHKCLNPDEQAQGILKDPLKYKLYVERLNKEFLAKRKLNYIENLEDLTKETLGKVVLKKGELSELKDLKRFAVFNMHTELFNGYFVLAVEDDNVVSSEITGSFRAEFMKGLGLLEENVNIEPVMLMEADQKLEEKDLLKAFEFFVKDIHNEQTVGIGYIDAPFELLPKFFKKSDTGSFMYKVPVDSIPKDSRLSYNVFLYLPKNNKFIKYFVNNSLFDNEQVDKMLSYQHSFVFVLQNELNHWKKHSAESYINYQFSKDADLMQEPNPLIRH